MRTLCVVFRTGGPDNFKWHRSLAFYSPDECHDVAVSVMKMGYPAMVVDYQHSISIGLPETFSTILHDVNSNGPDDVYWPSKTAE